MAVMADTETGLHAVDDGGFDGSQIEGQEKMEGLEPAPLDELKVTGPEQLSIFDVGGKRPASATIKLVGGKVALVDGTGFKKGTVIHFTGTAVINEVGQKDTHDPKTGMVVSAEQRHGARITDLTVEVQR